MIIHMNDICTLLGLLSPPANIQLELWPTGQYSTTAFLSWNQPFTLNVTNSHGDNIISYRVFVSLRNSSTLEIYNTSSTQFTYNYSAADTNCNNLLLLTFQVSAINRVGISERSDPLGVICNTGTSTCIHVRCSQQPLTTDGHGFFPLF